MFTLKQGPYVPFPGKPVLRVESPGKAPQPGSHPHPAPAPGILKRARLRGNTGSRRRSRARSQSHPRPRGSAAVPPESAPPGLTSGPAARSGPPRSPRRAGPGGNASAASLPAVLRRVPGQPADQPLPRPGAQVPAPPDWSPL